MKLTIWSNNDFQPAEETEHLRLIAALNQHELIEFSEATDGSTGTAREALERAGVAFGYPSPDAVVACHQLRWVQLNSAGYTTYDRDEIKTALRERGTLLTNSSAVFDEPCAQHVLAMMTSLTRQLPYAQDTQRSDQSWPMLKLRFASRLMNGQTVLLLGFGAIGRRLTELLQPLRVNITAVRRTIKGDEPIRVEHFSRVDQLLPLADHVVNILPANESTRHFLNASRFRRMKQGAVVYNIGRGATLDQDALLQELQRGHLGAAYLDVTEPEPLPSDHPLWRTPNCFITPHTAGGHANEKERLLNHFLENLHRFESDQPLLNRIV